MHASIETFGACCTYLVCAQTRECMHTHARTRVMLIARVQMHAHVCLPAHVCTSIAFVHMCMPLMHGRHACYNLGHAGARSKRSAAGAHAHQKKCIPCEEVKDERVACLCVPSGCLCMCVHIWLCTPHSHSHVYARMYARMHYHHAS